MLARLVVLIAAVLAGTAASHAQALQTVHIGVVNLSTDLAFYLAEKRGYLREEGLKADFVFFDSGAKMIAPLGRGDIDAGGGATSVGLYNAVERGIELKIVADKGTNVRGYDYKAIVVRKELADSGAIRSLADLKGRKAAVVAKGAADESVLHQAILKGGLADADVERLYVPFSQQLVAFRNGAIDAAVAGEPDIVQMQRAGVAVRLAGLSEFYPHEAAVLLYSGKFAGNRDLGTRLLKAYLRSVRDYDRALKDGRIAGPGADEIIAMLGEMTGIKDLSVFRDAVPPFIDPDGTLDAKSLETDLAYFKSMGVKPEMSTARVVDRSFAEAVVRALGPAPRSR